MNPKTVSMAGDFMPSKFGMIHAIADVIIIVGLTVWLNGKINAQAAEIEALKQENAQLKQRVEAIENVLRQMIGGGAPPPPPPEPKKPKKVASPTHSSESSSEEEVAEVE